METVLVDTSVVIAYFRKRDKQKTFFRQLAVSYPLAISNITKFELDIGIYNHEQYHKFQAIYAELDILPLSLNCTDRAAILYQRLKADNQLIEITDLLIAATALTYNLPLATLNPKHFERFEELECLTEGGETQAQRGI